MRSAKVRGFRTRLGKGEEKKKKYTSYGKENESSEEEILNRIEKAKRKRQPHSYDLCHGRL